MSKLGRVWHDSYPWLGGMGAALACDRLFDTPTRAFSSSSTSSALFSGLLTFSGLVVAVLLALLGILVSIDNKPVVHEIRRRGAYRNLVTLALIPMVVFMILSVFSVVGLFATKDDNYWFRVAVSDIAMGLIVLGLLCTLRFALQLIFVMVDDYDEDAGAKTITPEDAAERGAGRRPEKRASGAGTASSALATP